MTSNSTPALHFTLLALGFVLTMPADALAYVDPGTGSYLFQLAAAGLLAGVFTIRRYWEALRTTFRRESAGGSRPDGDSPRE